MKGFKYAGIKYDFAYVINVKTGEHVYPINGFALSSAISNKYSTLESSRSIIQPLKQFFEDLIFFNNLDWRTVTNEEVLSYLFNYRYKEKKASGKSINLHKAAIVSFYDWAYEYGFLDLPMKFNINFEDEDFKDHVDFNDPCKSVISQFISEYDFKKLINNIQGETIYIGRRNELVLLLGYYCGVRTHELTSPYNFNIDELIECITEAEKNGNKSFELTIYGKGNKKPRKILIPPKVFNKLKTFLKDKDNGRAKFIKEKPEVKALFVTKNGDPYKSSSLGTMVFADARNHCVGKEWKNRSYHSLRHSYATNLATWCAENSKDWRAVVPIRLGHEHWETSQIYVEIEALMNNRVEVLNTLTPKGRKSRHG